LTPEVYVALEARFRRLSLLGEASRLLEWDRAALMPRGGAQARIEQLTELALIRHEMMCDPALAELLDGAEAEALDAWQSANLAAMRGRWRHATAVPADLHEAETRAALACETAWREARPANDFAGLAPMLTEVVRLVREVATVKGEALACAPYDALLDQWDTGLRTADFEDLFVRLARDLPDLVAAVSERQAAEPQPRLPDGPFPVADQQRLAEWLMAAVGFPGEHGRLDTSLHPFSSGTPEDLRITTRYDEGDFTSAMMAVLHETGHALYDHGLPRDWRHQPVGDALGMSIHESQSLIVEMQACRSRAFMGFAAPLMREAFGGDGEAWSADNLYRLQTRVAPSLIRVEADEVTYPLHIILRTRLERLLIAGELEVGELPGAWAEGMRDSLGIIPPDDRNGCLQDIHWVEGIFGYFPTYTLGAVTAAQLFQAARRDKPELETALGEGDFRPLLGWLGENVHSLASSLDARALITRATGKALNASDFEAHLKARYLAD
jgi:carboxypeptidase Taq